MRIEELNKELEKTKSTLQDRTSQFNREAEALNLKVKAEVEKNFKLCETLKTLHDKCFCFATQCPLGEEAFLTLLGLHPKRPIIPPKIFQKHSNGLKKKLMILMKS